MPKKPDPAMTVLVSEAQRIRLAHLFDPVLAVHTSVVDPLPHQKLVLFTEHRDTLNYFENRITTLLGRKEAVVMIHGGMGREERMKAQESFKCDAVIETSDLLIFDRFKDEAERVIAR
ncbi:MAG: hypothetical protein K2Y16_03230 [Burkholderiales bacterium]|nr:hypothetical protein [Burkholderiales bacterium]